MFNEFRVSYGFITWVHNVFMIITVEHHLYITFPWLKIYTKWIRLKIGYPKNQWWIKCIPIKIANWGACTIFRHTKISCQVGWLDIPLSIPCNPHHFGSFPFLFMPRFHEYIYIHIYIYLTMEKEKNMQKWTRHRFFSSSISQCNGVISHCIRVSP